MFGLNQSELVFLIWIVFVANQILASFHGIFMKNHVQSEIKFHFRYILHIVVSHHQNVFFVLVVVFDQKTIKENVREW